MLIFVIACVFLVDSTFAVTLSDCARDATNLANRQIADGLSLV
jgi:hypothetical protein